LNSDYEENQAIDPKELIKITSCRAFLEFDLQSDDSLNSDDYEEEVINLCYQLEVASRTAAGYKYLINELSNISNFLESCYQQPCFKTLKVYTVELKLKTYFFVVKENIYGVYCQFVPGNRTKRKAT